MQKTTKTQSESLNLLNAPHFPVRPTIKFISFFSTQKDPSLSPEHRCDVVARQNAHFACSERQPTQPSLFELSVHPHHLSFPQLQLLRPSGFVVVKDGTPVESHIRFPSGEWLSPFVTKTFFPLTHKICSPFNIVLVTHTLIESCCVEEFLPSAEAEVIWGFNKAMVMVGGVSLVILVSL